MTERDWSPDAIRIFEMNVPEGFFRAAYGDADLGPLLRELSHGRDRFNLWLLELVAKIVVAEREACARIAETALADGDRKVIGDTMELEQPKPFGHECGWEQCCAEAIAARVARMIRARGEAPR